ncbi:MULTISPECIES: NAD(P)-dependent alcohol dehydrogenase [unclassified Streptomyces]|uniref:NAD(P)-dependent alcohol dehydrogenase n=1 Tax=unclassified Streptomyces TaxID=2593676 RepID=UPI00336A1B8F
MGKTSETQMRAVRFERYGPPDVLTVQKVAVPEPGAGQVLVKAFGSSVNPAEAQVRAGKFKLLTGSKFPKGIGEDFSGEIVAVGEGVERSLVGRRVWGTDLGLKSETTAEYIVVKESVTAWAPSRHDPVTLAALPTVGLTALLALRTVGVKAGGRVLIVGAAGGVGSAAVQLAHALGARVATVSGSANTDLCRELGAVAAYEYARLSTDPITEKFDAVIDLYGADPGVYRSLLVKGGRMVCLAAKGMGYSMKSAFLPGPRVRTARMKPSRADLDTLARHVEKGELRAVVEQIYPMEEIAEAHRAVETGHSRGKRVIQIVENLSS